MESGTKMKILSRQSKLFGRRAVWIALALFCFLGFFNISSVLAQKGPIPREHYYRGCSYLEQGNIAGALQHYQSDLKNATKIGTMRWIDSICYQAMIGETFYISGRTEEALAAFDEAISLYLQYPKWLSRVTYPTGITTIPRPDVPWGPGRRTSPIGVFPLDATIVIGDVLTKERINQGGMIRQQEMLRIDPMEILRCMSLAIRRRAEILGPLSRYDHRSDEILNAFSTRQISPNHWSVTWFDVLFGLALKGAGKNAESRDILNKSLVMAGQYDHNLTGVVLLELGKLYLLDEQISEAVDCFYEASISAFHFGDMLLVEEALRYYANAKKAMDRFDTDPVLLQAFEWFKHQSRCQFIQMSLSEELAENFVNIHQFKAATQGLKMIESFMKNSELRQSRYADRWNYLNALLFYSRGEITEGNVALAKTVEGMKFHSHWVFQIAYLDNLSKTGGLTTGSMTLRNAADLYEYLLREPTATDWAVQPMDCLAVQNIIPLGAFERWFLILQQRDLRDKAFDVAERTRRERFYSTQQFGGRLLSLRYLLEAAENCLPNEFKINRQDILIEFPEYNQLLKEARQIKTELHSLSISPKSSEEKTLQNQLLVELQKISAEQESILYYMAASRIRIPATFPPIKTAKEIQSAIPEETSMLAFYEAGGDMYAFMLTREVLDCWRIGSADRLNIQIANFLKGLGCSDGSKPIQTKDIVGNTKWQELGKNLLLGILGNPNSGGERFNVVFKHLIIVPEKSLWYLPFEALCIPSVQSQSETDEASKEQATSLTEQDDQNDQNGQVEEAIQDSLEVGQVQSDLIEENANKTKQVAQSSTKKERSPKKAQAAKDLVSFLAVPDLTIRYAATAGLGIPGRLGRSSFVETAVVPGLLYPNEPEKNQQDALFRLSQNISQMVVLARESYAVPSSVLSVRLKQLIVLSEIVGNNPNTYNWIPFLANKQKTANSILQWVRLPWGAPRLIILPGFRSGAENALKSNIDGNEFFFSILSMQASGADTILISRWRTGGRSSYDLVNFFMENIRSMDYASAWKKAVQSLWATEIVLNEEPRLKGLFPKDKTVWVDHPFFWSGFMLISPGESDVVIDDSEEVNGDYLPEELSEEEIEKLKTEKNHNAALEENPTATSNEDNIEGNIETTFDDVDLSSDYSDTDENNGLEPIIRVPGDSSDNQGDSENSGDLEKIDGLNEENGLNPKETEPKTVEQETSTGTSQKPDSKNETRPVAPRPITDEDIEKADQDADDFFSQNVPKKTEKKENDPPKSGEQPKK